MGCNPIVVKESVHQIKKFDLDVEVVKGFFDVCIKSDYDLLTGKKLKVYLAEVRDRGTKEIISEHQFMKQLLKFVGYDNFMVSWYLSSNLARIEVDTHRGGIEHIWLFVEECVKSS